MSLLPLSLTVCPSGTCGSSSQVSPLPLPSSDHFFADKPNDATLTHYIEVRGQGSPPRLTTCPQELKKHRVTDVVRVCESTYSSARLQAAGITCHDWAFDDGQYRCRP